MLRHLSIRDFVIVDALDLDFTQGFTVFSGETGAGKSILIDAIALVIGARAEAQMIRAHRARATITAEFIIKNDIREWLLEHALYTSDRISDDIPEQGNATYAEQSTVILRRVIESNGRSRAFINGTLVTLTQLRTLGERLVEIQGQQAHQCLMHGPAQRFSLDAYAQAIPLSEDVRKAWTTWQSTICAVKDELDRAHAQREARERLVWRLSELDALSPQPDEWEQLTAAHRRASHAASLADGVHQTLANLSESDDALITRLEAMLGSLRPLAEIDPALEETLAILEPAAIQLQEARYSLNRHAQQLDVDPGHLAELENRIEAFHTLSRKFGFPPQTLHVEHTQTRAQLDAMENANGNIAALHQAEIDAKAHYDALAQRLSEVRTQAALTLSKAVSIQMQTLSMPGGQFEATLIKLPEGGAHGYEEVEFRVAGHPGVPLRPLAKVASGGELSRISLALCVVTHGAGLTPTLIFDEVDSGIGGAAAEAVGDRLKQLAIDHQVLCVTHLPRVAACGESHFRITKHTSAENQTYSIVIPLNPDERTEEIARMLGGREITQTTREHAKEMVASACGKSKS